MSNPIKRGVEDAVEAAVRADYNTKTGLYRTRLERVEYDANMQFYIDGQSADLKTVWKLVPEQEWCLLCALGIEDAHSATRPAERVRGSR